LFYAALELRFGIEARLYEYIDATCQSLGVLSEERKEYAGTLLLKRLLRLDSDAGKEMTITIGDGSGVGVSLAYTPVTSVLAQMHGQLGGMMHVTFFRQNQDWSALAPTGAYGRQSLVFYRRFLGEVDVALAEATRGTMLMNPLFTRTFVQILSEEEAARIRAEPTTITGVVPAEVGSNVSFTTITAEEAAEMKPAVISFTVRVRGPEEKNDS